MRRHLIRCHRKCRNSLALFPLFTALLFLFLSSPVGNTQEIEPDKQTEAKTAVDHDSVQPNRAGAFEARAPPDVQNPARNTTETV